MFVGQGKGLRNINMLHVSEVLLQPVDSFSLRQLFFVVIQCSSPHRVTL